MNAAESRSLLRVAGDLAIGGVMAAGLYVVFYRVHVSSAGRFALGVSYVAALGAAWWAVNRSRRYLQWRKAMRGVPRATRRAARYSVHPASDGSFFVYDQAHSAYVKTFRGRDARQRAGRKLASLAGGRP